MSEKKKVIVDIFNDQYALISDEKEEHLIRASSLVDEIMNEIARKANLGDPKKVAVLTALRLSSKLLALESSLDEIEERKEKLVKLIEKEGLSSSFQSLTC